MRAPLLVAILAVSLLIAPPAASKSSSSSTHSHSTVPGVARNSHGHIARSEQAKVEFKKAHPCPSTGRAYGACPGYVIDHVVPLKRGGADAAYNMQWQTQAAARAKDRWE